MAEKYLNTRILLKYDTFENWQASKGILKPGEVAVCTVATAPTKDVNSVAAPQVLFKVGDGEHTFANLPWASGLAADVYSWAKAKEKPTYAASEITGLSDYISGKVQDTNTTYQIIAGSTAGMYQLQKKEINGGWTNEGNEFGVDENAIKELINGKANKATTLAGYGITDAKIEGSVITLGGNSITPLTEHQDISGKADNSTVNAIDGRLQTAEGEIDALQSGKLGKTEKAADSAKLEGKTKAEVISEARAGYATETYVDNKVAGSVQYLGLASKLIDLSTTAGKGDFYRASATFSGVDSGDLIVALKDNPKQLINETDYAVVKSSDDYKGTVKSVTVTGTNGLTGTGTVTESGTITLSHADTSSQASSKNSGRTYIQSVELDEYGHVTKLATGTETVVDTNTWRDVNVNGTQLKGTGIGTGAINFKNGSNVTISGSGNDITINAVDTKPNDGTFTVKGDGTSITGTGSMTANQAGNTEATLAVADYSNIVTAKNAGTSCTDAGDLVTEGGDTIFFCCGSSKF